MPRATRFRRVCLSLTALIALGAGPATAPADESIDALISRLGDTEPHARQSAYERLSALGQKAVPALRAAARGPRPAVADAAADLLLKGNWFRAADAPSVRLLLIGYGLLPPAERASVVQKIIEKRLPNYRAVALRVLMQDPADEVAWTALDAARFRPDAEWESLLTATGPDALPPALRLLLARSKHARGDAVAAVELIQRVLEQERDRPTATAQQLAWPNRVLLESESRPDRYAESAGRLREMLDRADDDDGDRAAMVDQLLDLHARHGPLPGFAADLKRADADAESRAGFSLAIAADRIGLPEAGAALMQAALRERPDETDVDRAARLFDTGTALQTAGQLDAACRVYEDITRVDTAPLRGRVMIAYVRLSELHGHADRPALAGDALQRALDRQDSPLSVRRNGKSELWSLEDEQARIYWYYLLDAQARGDTAAARKQARLILASGSTESGQFLDVLPTLQTAAGPDEIDAYFTRVFDRSKRQLDESPDEAVYYNDLAWLCARSDRRLPDALRWATKAVEMSPDESAFLDTLAEAKFRSGQVQEAIDLEIKALANDPDDADFMRKQLDRFRAAAATRPAN
ncbi:MAG TPA: hypothetical protein VF595_14550 [Tepidisphaeraceae bacterium]